MSKKNEPSLFIYSHNEKKIADRIGVGFMPAFIWIENGLGIKKFQADRVTNVVTILHDDKYSVLVKLQDGTRIYVDVDDKEQCENIVKAVKEACNLITAQGKLF